jgi:hypothetical protein
MPLHETVETLAAVAARQVVIPGWLQHLIDEHGPDAQVWVRTDRTPFGNYLMKVEVVR